MYSSVHMDHVTIYLKTDNIAQYGCFDEYKRFIIHKYLDKIIPLVTSQALFGATLVLIHKYFKGQLPFILI